MRSCFFQAGAPDYSIDLIPLSQKKFCQVAAVLTGDSGQQSRFSHNAGKRGVVFKVYFS